MFYYCDSYNDIILVIKLKIISNMFVCLFVNTTFNNISVISWRSVLLMEETSGPGENNRPVPNHWQICHIKMHTSPCSRFEFATPVVINTDCIGSCKSNYHTITAMMALPFKYIDIKTKMSIKYNKQGNVLRVMIFKQQIYLASW
jgi:hypothetical protein